MNQSYPSNWTEIATQVKDKARWICERCGQPHNPDKGYTLTVHHLDGNPTNCQEWNLATLCQRCHLKVQARSLIFQLYLIEPEECLIPRTQGMKESTEKGGDISGLQFPGRISETEGRAH